MIYGPAIRSGALLPEAIAVLVERRVAHFSGQAYSSGDAKPPRRSRVIALAARLFRNRNHVSSNRCRF